MKQDILHSQDQASLSTIPVELISMILSMLDDPKDLLNFDLVSQLFHTLAQEKSLWQTMIKRYLPHLEIMQAPRYQDDPKKLFEEHKQAFYISLAAMGNETAARKLDNRQIMEALKLAVANRNLEGVKAVLACQNITNRYAICSAMNKADDNDDLDICHALSTKCIIKTYNVGEHGDDFEIDFTKELEEQTLKVFDRINRRANKERKGEETNLKKRKYSFLS